MLSISCARAVPMLLQFAQMLLLPRSYCTIRAVWISCNVMFM